MAHDRERAGLHACAVCGRPRPPLAVEADDPYCSARCAKRAHGVRDPSGAAEDRSATRPGKPLRNRQRMQRTWRRTFHAWAERRITSKVLAQSCG